MILEYFEKKTNSNIRHPLFQIPIKKQRENMPMDPMFQVTLLIKTEKKRNKYILF